MIIVLDSCGLSAIMVKLKTLKFGVMIIVLDSCGLSAIMVKLKTLKLSVV